MNPLILLVNQFKKLGDTAKIEAYLDLQKRLLEFTGLKADDSRLSMSVRKEGDISININSRRVLALRLRQKTWRIQIMINDDNLAEARQFEGYLSREDEAFSNRSGVPATLIRFELDTKPYQNNRLMQLWETSVLDYLPTASGTPYRKEYNSCLLAATMNDEARQQLFNWMQQETLTDKDLESDEIKKLFNLDDSTVTPSVSDSNFTQNDNNMPNFPLNQILYGPPGTGKTYNTINKAIQIANPSFDLSQSRAIVKVEFDRLLQEGQIVFTTFHQSMSYEDFIEGIKPQREGSDDQPTITYTIEAGVFKRICNKAIQINETTDNFDEMYENFVSELAEKESIELETPSQKKKFVVRVNSNKNCVATAQTSVATPMIVTKRMIRSYLLEQKVVDWKPYTIPIAEYLRKNYPIKIRTGENLEKNAPLSMPTSKLDFETIYKAYSEEMKKRLATGTLIDLPINPNGKKWFLKALDDKGDALIYSQTQNDVGESVKKLKRDLKSIYRAYPNYGDIKTFSQTKKAMDIQKRLNIPNVAGGLYTWFLHFKEFERVYIHQEFTPDFIKNENNEIQTAKNYVLIIDEINRGNVSQIFGELITLIEEDKRLGKDEALTVILPYSKEKFGVPSNVYIIGTMNTADRSVEALDTALRRRFSFVEMPPQYNVIKTNEEIEFDLSKILRTINDRIEVLLNKDNLIGHSYFMSVETLEDLKSVFQNKIMPLLQEYFFGDYGKIGLVLGSGFVQKEVSKDNIFSDFAYDGGNDDFSSKLIYRLIDAEKMNDEVFKTAINNLINDKKNK